MMMHREGKRPRRNEKGASAVEFALVVPLLCFLLFAIISYGYMLSFRQAVSQAAAEGARKAAVTPPGIVDAERKSDAIAAVNEALSSYSMTCNSGALACSAKPDASCPTCWAVTVTYNYEADPLTPVFPGLGIVMPNILTYTAVAETS
jgi:Flp pilus assembly protein TadG